MIDIQFLSSKKIILHYFLISLLNNKLLTNYYTVVYKSNDSSFYDLKWGSEYLKRHAL